MVVPPQRLQHLEGRGLAADIDAAGSATNASLRTKLAGVLSGASNKLQPLLEGAKDVGSIIGRLVVAIIKGIAYSPYLFL